MSRRLLYIVNQANYFLSHRLALAKAAQAAGWEVQVATAAPRTTRFTATGRVPPPQRRNSSRRWRLSSAKRSRGG